MFRKNSIVILALCVAMLQIYGCSGIMKANHLISQERYDEAIPILKEQIAERPDFARARNKLGFAYLKTGQLDKAINEFENVLNKVPDEPYAILYLGMAYLNKEELGKAMDTWKMYKNVRAPLVEEEINRLMTVLLIAQSQRSAKTALAQEGQLKTNKPDANTIAVCYFNDLSADKSLRAFQKGLAAMVATDLSKIRNFKVIERLRLQALLQEMKLGQTGIVDPNTAPRVGKLLGTENLVTGNLSLGSIQVVASVSSSSNEKVLGSTSTKVEQENFYDLPGLVIQNCADILGIKLSDEEKAVIGVPHTKVYQAFIYYGQALDALDAGKWQDAKNLFEMALKEDPLFYLAKKGRDSCPGKNTPSIAEISVMTAVDLANVTERSIDKAEDQQARADKTASTASKGGCSGGSGHSH
ncbi:tetratricopeptide repeat protein [uncultured Desulfobacter sp.]|uniref:tetratricopeptide repeat protein n=1 Tax=uncultured Desulfobacter sp. TaxID=240139 RepID=UPI0029F4CE7D|nr:tetratricopeptide repeat protein [uncultured Desulfobacter sp.]